jgi:hypothetical protein
MMADPLVATRLLVRRSERERQAYVAGLRAAIDTLERLGSKRGLIALRAAVELGQLERDADQD